MRTPIYVKMRPNVDILCFQRIIVFSNSVEYTAEFKLLFFLQSDYQLASARGVSELVPCIRLLPNVSYIIE